MRRLFWLGIGVGVGVLVVRRITKTAEAYTPKGLADAVNGLGDTFRAFADDVRVAMLDRESELMDQLGVDVEGSAAADSAGSERAPGTPAARHGR